jgi:hypothetical protein
MTQYTHANWGVNALDLSNARVTVPPLDNGTTRFFCKNLQVRFMIDNNTVKEGAIGNGFLKMYLVVGKDSVAVVTNPLVADFYKTGGSFGFEGFWPYFRRQDPSDSKYKILREWTYPDDFVKQIARTQVQVSDKAASNQVPISLNIPLNMSLDVNAASPPNEYEPGSQLHFVMVAPNFSGTAFNPLIADQFSSGGTKNMYIKMYYRRMEDVANT